MINKETIKPLTILETDFVKVTPTLRNVDIRFTKKPGHENRSLDILLRHNEEKKAKELIKIPTATQKPTNRKNMLIRKNGQQTSPPSFAQGGN